MKTTFRYIVAVFVAGMALVSCSKENIIKDENVIPEVKGGRVITVSFGETMKSTLAEGSSTQPVFVNGDEIFITNGEDNEKSTVEVKTDPGTQKQVAIIRTLLPGALTAVYPYDAAIVGSIVKQDGGCPTVDITLSNQNGSFATANISKAEVNAAENMMTFENQTALLKVTLPENTTKLTVKSLSDKNITEDGKTLTIGSTEKSIVSQTGISYVAILPGVNLSDLSFDAAVNETSGSLKGIPAKTFATGDANRNVTARNSIYKIGASNWHPYVVVNGKKWATMNIGAENETDPGEYFMWAEVVGHKYNGTTWDFPADNPDTQRYTSTWNSSAGFAYCNTPYSTSTSGASYSKYKTADTTLEKIDDAANYNWGGSWRMPTYDEIAALGIRDDKDQTTGVHMSDDGKYLVVDGTSLKFNCTGQVSGTNTISNPPTTGCYWTSTGGGTGNLDYFYFKVGQIQFGGRNRYTGLAIRPVSD